MPEQQDINIRIKLNDQATVNLKKVIGSFRDFALQMRQAGRQISYVGMSITAIGASIVAPLTLAYKTAGKFNAEIASQLEETKNVFDNLSVTIGKSLLPVMKKLTDSIAGTVNWWNSLDKVVREKIIQDIWKLGTALITLGTTLVIVGHSLSVLGNIFLILATLGSHPAILAVSLVIIGIALAFALLTYAMLKWKPVADNTIRTLAAIANFNPLLFKKIDAEAMIAGFDKVRDNLGDFATWWKGLQGGISNGGNAAKPAGSFWEGFKLQLKETQKELSDWAQVGSQIVLGMTNNMKTAFSSFFDDAFSGQLKKAQDYFAEFGRGLLKTFSDIISQMITNWILFGNMMGEKNSAGKWGGIVGSILNLFGQNTAKKVSVSSFHQGGLIRAHSGLAIDEVPIIAQSGERVLSRSQNKAYEQGNKQQPVVVFIQAWDTQDIMRNRKSIEGIIINALKQNSGVRGAVKTYG